MLHFKAGGGGFNQNKVASVFLSIAAISLGASLGAILRWALGTHLNPLFPSLPPGTLASNLLGGYLIGVAMAFFASHPSLSPQWRLLIVTGFLGGLTTFSSFSAEVVEQLTGERPAWALWIIAAHVAGSLFMTLLGIATVSSIRAARLSGD